MVQNHSISECQLLIPVLQLTKGHCLCPVQAYERHLSVFPAPHISPAFLHSISGHATPITIMNSQLNRARFLVKQASMPPNSLVTVFVAVVLLMPSVAVFPWNLSAFRGIGRLTQSTCTSHSPWNDGCPWPN